MTENRSQFEILKAQKQEQDRWKQIDKSRKKIGLAETVKYLALEGSWLDGAMRRQEIDDQWNAAKPLGWKDNFSGERRMLYDVLDEDESIESLVGGTFRQDTHRLHKHKGIAVATSKRLMFLDKGVFGSTETMEMPYRNVEAITYSTGLMAGGIQVTGRGMASFRLEDVFQKDSLRPFADCVRNHAEAGENPVKDAETETSTGSSLDEIERLAQFLERGIITQAEFDAKKKQLLGV